MAEKELGFFSKNSISANLTCQADIIFEQCVSSTNTVLKEIAENGADEFTVLVANKQTNGRGSKGRAFFSYNDGIYLSILLRPQQILEKCQLITALAAVCVANAIKEVCKIDCGIKWVNDIFINNKKVCGILTESVLDCGCNKMKYAVLGIGINFCAKESDFPDELRHIAGTIFEEKPENCELLKSTLTARIVDNIYYCYRDFNVQNIIYNYRKMSILIGKEINVTSFDKSYSAKVVDIDNNAHLVVRDENGSLITLSSGDVSLKITPLNHTC